MGNGARAVARFRGLVRGWLATGGAARNGLADVLPEQPLELRIVGRVLFHAAIVGVAAGLVGALLFWSLEQGQRLLLEGLAGYVPLRAHGEALREARPHPELRLWVLALLPALGGLASGVLTTWLAPETAGGGGDATIEAYHRGGIVRWRVIPVKMVAAVAALASGGSGGREGPTMQIGAGIGSLVGRFLPASRTERRVLYVAGVAAGISAVFRTPLGAALLATEMLYRDDFEADALVPSVLASVVSYSVVIGAFGETTLFSVPMRFPFQPGHLPLYALLAVSVATAAALFVRLLRSVQEASRRLPLPVWARPALGGLAVGIIGTGLALALAGNLGAGARPGVFGGGYGLAQAAIDGASWFPAGWKVVLLLAGLALAKMIASALTIGTGGAAGDFAPSLVVGALVGAAFGYGAAAVTGDPTIHPAAFALVGMGTFYGGIAHAPLSALVLVSELAGSYDLLVPMMLTVGIAFVALRRWSLYEAQPADRGASPVHRADRAVALAPPGPIRDLVVAFDLPEFPESAPLSDLARAAAGARQRVAIVRGGDGRPRGLVDLSLLTLLGAAELGFARAADAMVPYATVPASADWKDALQALQRHGLAQLPVVSDGALVGWIGDRELVRAAVAGEPASPAPALTP